MIALQGYRAIWQACFDERMLVRPAAMRKLIAWLGLFGCVLAFTAFRDELWHALLMTARVAAGAGAVWLGLNWTLIYVPKSVALNSAVNARLLPRQRLRFVQLAAAGWALGAAGIALAAGCWQALPLAGLCLLGLGLGSARNTSATLGYVMAAGIGAVFAAVALPPAMRHAAVDAAWHAAPLLLALTLLGLPWVLRALYPAGGDAHLARAARRPRVALDEVDAARQARPRLATMTEWGIRPLYLASLRRACRARDPGALLLYALGPSAHWSVWCRGALVTLLVGTMLMSTLDWWHHKSDGGLLHSAAGNISWLGMMMMWDAVVHRPLMQRTRGEQALLRLSPLAGDAALLNRRLGTRILVNTLCCWAGLAALVAGLPMLAGTGSGVALRNLLMCCLACHAACIALVVDFWADAKHPHASTAPLFGGMTLGFLEAGAGFVIARLTHTSPWPWMFALPLAGTVLALGLCRRRMQIAAPKFPVNP